MLGENTDIIQYDNDKCIIKANNDNIDLIKENILDNIKLDNISNFISEISKNGTYQFVNAPKGGYLYQYADGTVSGIWRNADNGKILEHGHLKKVGMNVGNVCKLAANQAMFAYIIVQLDEINKKLDIILEGMHNDRIAQIDGAIRTFEHFEDARDENFISVVQQIETGISQLEKELNQLSNKLSPNSKFSDNWLAFKKNKENEKTHNQFVETVSWIFKGYETLFKINQMSGKNAGAEHLINFLQAGKWKELSELARGLEYKKTQLGYPEERWEKIEKEKPILVKNLRNMIDIEKKEINEYIIEFKGDYLLEVLK